MYHATVSGLINRNEFCIAESAYKMLWSAFMEVPDLAPEPDKLIVIAAATVYDAERLVESCENCNQASAEIPFDWILDRITDSDSATTDYVMEVLATCPRCQRPILEKTLVEPLEDV